MNIDKIIQGKKVIGIAGHINPDGDCIGACMGLYNYIVDNFKESEVHVYLEPIPNIFKFMKHSQIIESEMTENRHHDLFIALDCGDTGRLGKFSEYFIDAKETFCVDHHETNKGFADNNYIFPKASSACELMCELVEDEKMTKTIAECFYTGIVHDTAVFQYSCTSSKTMNIAGKLMDKGIDYSKIIDDTFYTKTYHQNQVMGEALIRSKLYLDGKCVASYIDEEAMEKYHVLPKHLDGIVNQLRVTKDVKIAIFLYELTKGEFKVSLRSNCDINVAKIAVKFGGGGHDKAAGFSAFDEPNEIINRVVCEIANYVNNDK